MAMAPSWPTDGNPADNLARTAAFHHNEDPGDLFYRGGEGARGAGRRLAHHAQRAAHPEQEGAGMRVFVELPGRPCPTACAACSPSTTAAAPSGSATTRTLRARRSRRPRRARSLSTAKLHPITSIRTTVQARPKGLSLEQPVPPPPEGHLVPDEIFDQDDGVSATASC